MIAGSALAERAIAEGGVPIYMDAPASAQVNVDLNGEMLTQKLADGLAQVVVQSSGDIVRGLTGESLAQVEVSSTADFTRRAIGSALFGIEFQADGDFRVVPPASAVFNIRVNSTLDGETKTPKFGEAWFLIETRAIGYEIKRNTYSPAMPMVIRTNMKGSANVQAVMPLSRGTIELYATGDLKKGAKLYGSGKAVAAELFMRGAINTRHYVYAAGSAQVSIKLTDNGYGIPPIPATFISAPANRTMYSAPDRRTMYSNADRSITP